MSDEVSAWSPSGAPSGGGGWVPSRPVDDGRVYVRTLEVRFSQSTIGATTWLAGKQIPLRTLAERFARDGYVSEPIEVVPIAPGQFISLDNRRVWAARTVGLECVPAHIREFSDYLPSGRRVLLERTIYASADGLSRDSSSGSMIYPKGVRAATFGEAVLFKAASQPNLSSGAKFPLEGSLELPRVTSGLPTLRSITDLAGGERHPHRLGYSRRRRDRGMER